jgi:DNA adenine methylase
MCRYNNSGKFNVPFGDYTNPYFPSKELANCCDIIKNFTIKNKDFREIFKIVKEDDVIYCDPPYMPISTTASFVDYDTNGFGFKDHVDLARCAQKAERSGATVIVSNHYNYYTKGLYEMYGAKIVKLMASRTISSKVDKRDPVQELIAIFNEV